MVCLIKANSFKILPQYFPSTFSIFHNIPRSTFWFLVVIQLLCSESAFLDNRFVHKTLFTNYFLPFKTEIYEVSVFHQPESHQSRKMSFLLIHRSDHKYAWVQSKGILKRAAKVLSVSKGKSLTTKMFKLVIINFSDQWQG